MLWLQQAYISRLSFCLQNLTRVGDNYRFRCPFCGDSKKNALKSRGYLYVSGDGDNYNFRCHNCGESYSFSNFLKKIDMGLYEEYTFENFKNLGVNKPKPQKQNNEIFNKNLIPNFMRNNYHPKLNIPSVQSLKYDHECKKYVIGRKIPKFFWDKLFYAENFNDFICELSGEEKTYPNDRRLVIPAYNENKKLIYLQGRSLEKDSKIRYFTYEYDKNHKKIYGLDRVKYNKTIYVFEGPIDSMFIDNSIAVMDSNLSMSGQMIKDGTILVFDNQPRNAQFMKNVKKAVDLGYKCCFFPEWVDGKDVNEMILNGLTSEQIEDIIQKNSYSGIQAKMRYNTWKKV